MQMVDDQRENTGNWKQKHRLHGSKFIKINKKVKNVNKMLMGIINKEGKRIIDLFTIYYSSSLYGVQVKKCILDMMIIFTFGHLNSIHETSYYSFIINDRFL